MLNFSNQPPSAKQLVIVSVVALWFQMGDVCEQLVCHPFCLLNRKIQPYTLWFQVSLYTKLKLNCKLTNSKTDFIQTQKKQTKIHQNRLGLYRSSNHQPGLVKINPYWKYSGSTRCFSLLYVMLYVGMPGSISFSYMPWIHQLRMRMKMKMSSASVYLPGNS